MSNPIDPNYSVLFVCTANLARSPMAEALFSRMLEGEGIRRDWRVESAGTWTHPGLKVPREIQKVMADRKIDLSEHYSRLVSADLLKEFALILVMEQGHKEALRAEFPEAAGRVYLLTEMVGKHTSVADPVEGTSEEYLQTAAELEDLLVKGRARIEALAGKA